MTDTITLPLSHANPVTYQAAYEGAVLYDSSAAGRIWMRDKDRASLLHRLSTNQIEKLNPGQGNQTVLTTPIGRIIDLLTVHVADDGILLVTSPGNGQAIFRHLRKNIFFNDKVKLEDASADLAQLTLYGPKAAELLGTLGLPNELALHHHVAAEWNGAALRIARTLPLGGQGFTIFAPATIREQLSEAIQVAGATPLDAETYDVLRVEAGYGEFKHELGEEYIPLETGLWDAISFTKGCYVGQEIIARMESRGRMAKQLRGLRFSTLPQELSVPSKLAVAGKEAGDLTSVVESPRYGIIGLAYVRTAHSEPGTPVGVQDVTADVVELPFN